MSQKFRFRITPPVVEVEGHGAYAVTVAAIMLLAMAISAMAWSAAREREPLFPVVGMAKPSLHRDLPACARRRGGRDRDPSRRSALRLAAIFVTFFN
jgi:hypothetical protein